MIMMMIPLTSSQDSLNDTYLLLCIEYWTRGDDPASSQQNLYDIYLLLCIQY